MKRPPGYAQSVVHLMTGLGVPGVVRVKGTATIFAPGWTGKAYGPGILPHHASVGMVLDTIAEQYTRELGAPFLVRCFDHDTERALVTVRLEDFAQMLAVTRERS